MTRDEFQMGMKEILVFYRAPRSPDEKTDFSLYMDGLFSQVSWMQAEPFRRVCFELAGELREDEKKPMTYRFKAAYARLEDEARRNLKLAGMPEPTLTAQENREIMLQDARAASPNGARMALDRAAQLGTTLPPEVVEILEEKVRSGSATNIVVEQRIKTS